MNKYIVKGDLSGIQNFIFDIKSKGAARELKKRSLYVTNLAKELFAKDLEFFGKDNVEEIYIGGGNYFYEIETDKDEDELNKYFSQRSHEFLLNEIYPHYAWGKSGQTFKESMTQVNLEMLRVKQQRLISNSPFKKSISSLSDNIDGVGINFHYPKDEKGNILDFDKIALKGKGDHKLAALKLDVDQLGNVFRNQTKSDYSLLSNELGDFFDQKLLELIQKNQITDEVYVVFSGGDDCFLIGTWHTIINMALLIKKEFDSLNDELRKNVKTLNQNITFSAGITIFPPKYPLKQMADEVEDYLSQAKTEGRNKITILGHSLTWNEYDKVLKIKNQLYDLVMKKGESKALIQRIKSSKIGYEALQNRAVNGKLELPKVWNLKYYLRNIKKDNSKEVEELFDTYSKSLIDAFMSKENATNPMIYPIAARLTELLIKNNNNE